MTQLNLVESAKQGDPQAIAVLMNLALEPRGVTARTKLNDGCLYICLRSSYVLNQAPLVKFIRRGLAGLGIQSIQTVTIYGQKIGQPTPMWRETLQLGETRPRIRQKSQPVEPQTGAAISDRPATQTVPQVINDSPRSSHPVTTATVEPPPVTTTAPPPVPPKPVRRSAKAPRHSHKPKKLRVAKRSRSTKYRITSLTALIAFLSGGTAAIVTFANAQTASRPTTTPSSSTLTAPDGSRLPSEADLVNIKRQQEAKQYLRTMNQAQQAFYQHHQRFAADLEELERSANLIARSYHYTYKLTATDQLQAQLTAVPKETGLKSYTAVVSLVQLPQQTITTAALICESAQPSQTSPTLILTSGQPIACPTGAAAVQ